jgi:uncharacterized membrane protein YkvA (DUF1232 family)
MIRTAKQWAARLKRDIGALYVAGRDPRTPGYAKVLALAVAIYAISPIDLIPDFIPILGYLDDLIIVPLGIMLAVRSIPATLMAEFRRTAAERGRVPAHWAGAAVVISMWCLGLLGLAWWALS